MKKFLNWILIIIAILIVIFAVGGLMLPSTWIVSETALISASPKKVYEQIADLRNWQNWSSWTKESDPTQEYSYEGPLSGTGAKWLWTSKTMGKGWLLIDEADPHEGIKYDLYIDMNGSESTIHGAIKYAQETPGLKVIWTDSGDSGTNLSKRWLAALFIKPMLAREMKAGLIKLKTITEAK